MKTQIEKIIEINPNFTEKIAEVNINKKHKRITNAKTKVVLEIEDLGNIKNNYIGLQVRIESIIVNRKDRGKGIGTVEVNNIIQWALDIGAGEIILESKRSAIPFWKKMGFEINDQKDKISTCTLVLNNKIESIVYAYNKAKLSGNNPNYVNLIESLV